MSRLFVLYHRQQAKYFTEDLGPGIELKMVRIPGGEFLMGSPNQEKESRDNERPQHPVTVQPFCMGMYPITQAQWKVVAATRTPVKLELNPNCSRFTGNDQRPVEQVSWYEAEEFCARLRRDTDKDYRLPTEAEWEYACRAGTTTPFHFGSTITPELANYKGNHSYGDGPKGVYREQTTPVGAFGVANAFGLYDMHGNVLEWCQDHYHGNYREAPEVGKAWLSDNEAASRILRGGSWVDLPEGCRSAYRNGYVPRHPFKGIGFRVVCSAARTP